MNVRTFCRNLGSHDYPFFCRRTSCLTLGLLFFIVHFLLQYGNLCDELVLIFYAQLYLFSFHRFLLSCRYVVCGNLRFGPSWPWYWSAHDLVVNVRHSWMGGFVSGTSYMVITTGSGHSGLLLEFLMASWFLNNALAL